jgi:anti-sigma factor RsiW
MHAVLLESLEEYLAGTLTPADQREIEAHLSTCESCREELRSLQEVSRLLMSLRSEEVMDPAPGFFAGVVSQIGVQRTAARSFASLFTLDLAFGRRLAFASLLTLAILGSYLVSRESAYPAGPSPETVMAQQELPAFDSAPAQDNMLVTLTAYEH